MDKITPMPIGIEFYKEMITKGYYYVDKTLLIWDLLAYRNKVTLFTRPRRFGKTLAQSMVKTFFEKEVLPDGTVADNSVYFQGKKIMYSGEEYLKHMGQYPICTNLLVKKRDLCHNKSQGVIYYGYKYRRINKTFTRRIPAGML